MISTSINIFDYYKYRKVAYIPHNSRVYLYHAAFNCISLMAFTLHNNPFTASSYEVWAQRKMPLIQFILTYIFLIIRLRNAYALNHTALNICGFMKGIKERAFFWFNVIYSMMYFCQEKIVYIWFIYTSLFTNHCRWSIECNIFFFT